MAIRNVISVLVVTIVAAAFNIHENAVTPSPETTEFSDIDKHQQRGDDQLDQKGLKEMKDIFVPMKNEIGDLYNEKNPEEKQNFHKSYKLNTPLSAIEWLLDDNLIFEEKMMKKLRKMEKRIKVLMQDTDKFRVSKATLKKFLRKIESLKKIINEWLEASGGRSFLSQIVEHLNNLNNDLLRSVRKCVKLGPDIRKLRTLLGNIIAG